MHWGPADLSFHGLTLGALRLSPCRGSTQNAKLSPVLLGTTGNAEHFQRAFSFAEDLISLQESFRFHLNLGSNQVTAKVMCCISFESTCPAESRGSGNICWGCGLPPMRSWIDHRSPPVNSFPDPDCNHFLPRYRCSFYNLHMNSSWSTLSLSIVKEYFDILFQPDINYAEDKNDVTCFSETLRDSNTVLRDDKCSEKDYVDRMIQKEIPSSLITFQFSPAGGCL